MNELLVEAIEVCPPGTFPITVTNIEAVEIDTSSGVWVAYRFSFDVSDGDKSYSLSSSTGRECSPRTNLGKYLAGLGFYPESGQAIDLSVCIGSSALGVISTQENGYAKLESIVAAP